MEEKKCKCVNCECKTCNSEETPWEGVWECDVDCNNGSEMGDCCTHKKEKWLPQVVVIINAHVAIHLQVQPVNVQV